MGLDCLQKSHLGLPHAQPLPLGTGTLFRLRQLNPPLSPSEEEVCGGVFCCLFLGCWLRFLPVSLGVALSVSDAHWATNGACGFHHPSCQPASPAAGPACPSVGFGSGSSSQRADLLLLTSVQRVGVWSGAYDLMSSSSKVNRFFCPLLFTVNSTNCPKHKSITVHISLLKLQFYFCNIPAK